jgi:hypothetical protein
MLYGRVSDVILRAVSGRVVLILPRSKSYDLVVYTALFFMGVNRLKS